MDIFGDTPTDNGKSDVLEQDAVKWEYKESKDSKLIGPLSSKAMLKV